MARSAAACTASATASAMPPSSKRGDARRRHAARRGGGGADRGGVALAGDERRGAVYAGDGEPARHVRLEPSAIRRRRRSRRRSRPAGPGMHPPTAVAKSNCSSASIDHEAGRARTGPPRRRSGSPERAGHEQEHAEPQRGGDVGHDAGHARAAGSAACRLLSDTPAATETSGAVAQQRRRPRRARRPRAGGARRPRRRRTPATSSAATAATPRRAAGGRSRRPRRTCRGTRARAVGEPGPAPSLGQGPGDVPGADEPDVHGGPGARRPARPLRTD